MNHLKNWLKTSAITLSLLLVGCNDKTPEEPEMVTRINAALEKAAETQGDGNPALWKMSDDDTEIYIFGSYHLLPESAKWTTSEMLAEFDRADTLIQEVDTTSDYESVLAELMMTRVSLPDGQKLKDLMSRKQYKTVLAAAKKMGLRESNIEEMQPWLLTIQMQMQPLIESGYMGELGVEEVLTERALKQGKKFVGLETVEDQLGFLIPNDMNIQVEALVNTAAGYDYMGKMNDRMMEEWLDGDMAGMDAIFSDPELFGAKEVYDNILVKRNRNWIPQLEAFLDEPGVKFVAVGGAHLAGPDSVILMLQDNGHKVEVVQ